MIISKKIKNNREYFYLKHNVRVDEKIISKEKYLGLKIPKNIDEIKNKFYNELNKEIFKKFDKIKESFQSEWKKLPETIKKNELEEIAISFTYNTNAIEGSTITLAETRDIISYKQAPSKQLSDIGETKKHCEVFLEALRENNLIDKKLILEWHKNMFSETKKDIAGKFRKYLVRVGNYIAPDFEEVIPLMDNLIKFIKNSKIHPVELAARAHYIFEMIHPFGDGNGRIGRLLMNYILWNSNYPMIIIEYKNRKIYYKSLEKEEQDFVQYFIKLYLKIHKKRYL